MRPPLLLLIAGLLVFPASAHEFWIEPSRYDPSPGELVKVRLFVGEGLAGEPVPRFSTWIDRFDAIREGSVTPVTGIDGGDPAGLLRLGGDGPAVLAYAGKPAYLAAERERFSRCAKALLTAGGRGGAAFTRPVGLTLELVPERDPTSAGSGETFSVRLLYRGRPLAGALVEAMSRGTGAGAIRARTNGAGRARLPIPSGGRWLVHAVHVVPVRDDPRADRESFWASLTFEVAERE